MSDIITYPLDGIDYDATDAAGYFATRQSGVYCAEDCFAVSLAGGANLTVSKGLAWVHPSEFTGYSIIQRDAQSLALSAASTELPRIDRIVLRFDAAARKSSLQVLQGTAASSPVAPALTRTALVYDLCLAEIKRPAGSASITASDLTDTRLDEDLCGVMRDGVTGIPTEDLLTQAKARFAGLEETASASAKAAKDSESAAKSSQTAAAGSASAAKTSETNAGAKATAAANSATAAAGSASAAAGSATNAANSATAAKNSQTAAASSASAAKASENAAAESVRQAATLANVDTTLSVSGAPADAKAVGTALGGKAPSSHTHTKSQISDFPSALKNPAALTVQANGSTLASYDGSAAKTVNLTKGSLGLGSVDNTADNAKSVKYAVSAGSASNVNGYTITAGTAGLTADSSPLATGTLYLQYK